MLLEDSNNVEVRRCVLKPVRTFVAEETLLTDQTWFQVSLLPSRNDIELTRLAIFKMTWFEHAILNSQC